MHDDLPATVHQTGPSVLPADIAADYIPTVRDAGFIGARKYVFWTDAMLRDAVGKVLPALVPIFDQSPNICKADIGRYAVMYLEGGIYLDTDIKLTSRVENLFANRERGQVTLSRSPAIMPGGTPKLTNYAMASPKGHAFWEALLMEIEKRWHSWPNKLFHYAPYLTGAWAVTAVVRRRPFYVHVADDVVNRLCYNNLKLGTAIHDGNTSRVRPQPWAYGVGMLWLYRRDCDMREMLGLKLDTYQIPAILVAVLFVVILFFKCVFYSCRLSSLYTRKG